MTIYVYTYDFILKLNGNWNAAGLYITHSPKRENFVDLSPTRHQTADI